MTTFLSKKFQWILLFVAFFLLSVAFSKPPDLSPKEKTAVNKLRAALGRRLTTNYMKADSYLIKWLKGNNFDEAQTVKAIEKVFEWRKQFDADNIPLQDFSDIQKRYILNFTATKDKVGRPVVLLVLGSWNIRRKALEGKISDLEKYLMFMEESVAQLSYNSTGESSASIIVDFTGISGRQHLCLGCIPLYLNYVRQHELYYPYSMYRTVGINMPGIFEPILQLALPLMKEYTRKGLKAFGYDRNEWSRHIQKEIDLNQLPVRFGGTRKIKI